MGLISRVSSRTYRSRAAHSIMSDEESHMSGEESGETQPEVVIEPKNLALGDMANCLSMLCKIDNGLAHAYVKLSAKNMRLTSVEVLEKYKHLRYVDISSNHITELFHLNELKSLLWLKANNNQAASARLNTLPYLQVVDFSHNKIGSVMGIEHPVLEQLNLSWNLIPSCEGLDPVTLPHLQTLQLRSNKLTTTSGLENFKTLRHLFIADNKITSLEGISTLENLELLHARDNQIVSFGEDIKDGSPKKLKYINVRANNIADFDEERKLYYKIILLSKKKTID